MSHHLGEKNAPYITPHILKHIEVTGFNGDGKVVGAMKARVKVGTLWINPRHAKKSLRKLGAVYFSRRNVWQ